VPSCQRRLFLRTWLFLLSGGVANFTHAAELGDAAAVPQLGARGIESYRAFLDAGSHRAFAVAPGGAWAWHADLPSSDMAEQAALDSCREHTAATCVPYAVDDRVVFDAKVWPTLWGPYADGATAARAQTGVRRGERFPDIVFRDAAGKRLKVSDFRAKVLVLHFWGSWCGPCRRELPEFQQLVRRMAPARDIRFVFLPVREPFEVARAWAQTQKFQLPLFDAGEKEFTLASGERLPDRQVAGKFPTTYVLDKHGLVIFSHVGDAVRWLEYAPFLADAARRSGR
jgi:thiol-disulfide isomerase/thioredoxin